MPCLLLTLTNFNEYNNVEEQSNMMKHLFIICNHNPRLTQLFKMFVLFLGINRLNILSPVENLLLLLLCYYHLNPTHYSCWQTIESQDRQQHSTTLISNWPHLDIWGLLPAAKRDTWTKQKVSKCYRFRSEKFL